MRYQRRFNPVGASLGAVLSIILPTILAGCLSLPVQPGDDVDPREVSPEDIQQTTMLATMLSVELGGIDKAEVPRILRILDEVEDGLMMSAPPDFAGVRAFASRKTQGATRILVTMVIARAERYWPYFVDQTTEQGMEAFRTILKAVIDGGRDGLSLAA